MLNAGGFQQPAIKDYAIIGDCRTAALISREGSIDWLCLADFSSASVFARLLDQRGGHFSIKPRSKFITRRRYLPATAVLETIFETDTGAVRLIDLCPIVDSLRSLEPMREILRIVEGIEGHVDLEIEFAPRPNYGRTKPAVGQIGDAVLTFGWSNQLLLLNSSLRFIQDGDGLRGTARSAAGKREYLSLSYVDGDIGTIAPLASQADARCGRTIAWWRDWSTACQFEGPKRDVVLRSAITLKLLTFCLSGAIVAAPTTSLPETIGGERNWDYRYCWLRDAGLTMGALVELGFHQEASMCWVALDKLLWLHEKGIVQVGSHEALFRQTRQQIAECIEIEGFSRDFNSYTSELDGSDVDAALLLMTCFGYRDPSHPRMVSTYHRIQRELGCNGLLYRYKPGYDGLPGREGAVGICSFFAISHLAKRGLWREAVRSFDHLCSFGNDLDLFAEEMEPWSGRAIGNYPQAFTHVGLIHSALSIQQARRQAAR